MSSFKKADGIIDSIQKQAAGLRTLDGSAIEDFLSIAGYEDPARGGGGGAVICHTSGNNTEATPNGTLDKTFGEIYTALKDGIPVYVATGEETSGPSSDYSCGYGVLPVLCATKYDTNYKVYVADKRLGKVSGYYYAGAPAIVTFTASSVADYPTRSDLVSPTSVTREN